MENKKQKIKIILPRGILVVVIRKNIEKNGEHV